MLCEEHYFFLVSVGGAPTVTTSQVVVKLNRVNAEGNIDWFSSDGGVGNLGMKCEVFDSAFT